MGHCTDKTSGESSSTVIITDLSELAYIIIALCRRGEEMQENMLKYTFCIILVTVLHYACMHLISKQSCINYNHYIIRGEPERAPNTRVTYGEFAVPMYVCIYVCMYVFM